ncbi:MAG: VIT1/CCC1 transporter family protein [Prolixibacteraceae bacterium]|jgi:VIT1/CCC1 family predicted Fe2+/Mn2+ transporter|nr:VIT1/CCC1 transporter family protein [Prolixibacteraceae bacterium]
MNRKSISPETRRQLIQAQRNEITEYHIYKRLAKFAKNEANRILLERIAKDEKKHYTICHRYTDREVAPDKRQIRKYYQLARIFGLTFGLKLMERDEEKAQVSYELMAEEVPEALQIAQEENQHEKELLELIKEDRLEYIGSIVLGLNDALVEILGTLAGLTFALQNTKLVALAGIIAGIAGALSMSSSEYLSNKTEGRAGMAVKSAVFTGIAYLFAVVFLVGPYLFFSSPFVALVVALINSILIVLMFTYYISVTREQPFRKRFFEMVVLSTFVGLVSFGLGYLARIVFGIDI